MLDFDLNSLHTCSFPLFFVDPCYYTLSYISPLYSVLPLTNLSFSLGGYVVSNNMMFQALFTSLPQIMFSICLTMNILHIKKGQLLKTLERFMKTI
jgi:hypothetical protein